MKLAMASCARLQDVNPQPVWAAVAAARPHALLLLGDSIYLGRDDHDDAQALAAELRRRYDAQLAEPNFAALCADLRARGGTLAAIYDDHDFLGDDRCGADEPPALREAARAEFVRAFAPPRTGDEVYRVHPLDGLDLVVPDLRFHRRREVRPGDADALLGAAQWAWLEGVVAASRAPYLALASSSTFHDFGGDSWERHPAAFARLRRLLRGRRGALVLSGDVHRNAVYDDSGVIEIVSSGIAGIGRLFGVERCHWGLLDFDADGLRVRLQARKVGGRFDFSIPLARWQLP